MALSSSFGQFLFYDVNALLPMLVFGGFQLSGFRFFPNNICAQKPDRRIDPFLLFATQIPSFGLIGRRRTSSLISPSGGGGRLVSPFFLFFFLFIISFWRTKSSWRMDGTGRRVRRGTPPSVTQSEEIWPYKRRSQSRITVIIQWPTGSQFSLSWGQILGR